MVANKLHTSRVRTYHAASVTGGNNVQENSNLLCAAILGAFVLVSAQQPTAMAEATPPIKRIPLQRFDIPGTNYETVVAIAEIAPNVNVGRHTHPGPESSYVLEGEVTLLVEGKPPQQFKAGGVFNIPPGTIHDAKTGPGGAESARHLHRREGQAACLTDPIARAPPNG